MARRTAAQNMLPRDEVLLKCEGIAFDPLALGYSGKQRRSRYQCAAYSAWSSAEWAPIAKVTRPREHSGEAMPGPFGSIPG
jgi:hypothetical protein